MAYIPKNSILAPTVEIQPTNPPEGFRGLYPTDNGWYDIDDNGNIEKIAAIHDDGNFATSNVDTQEFYGENNLASGNENKIGTKGFIITGFSGVNGGTGTYTFSASNSTYNEINSALSSGEELRITIFNEMHCDNFCKITGVAYQSNQIVITVDNFYSNENSTATVSYSSSKSYKAGGYPYTYAPHLGYSVKKQTAYLFIHNHPEWGTTVVRDNGVSLGGDNINQGKLSFNAGSGNRAYGSYSSNIGKGNRSGYDTHIFGRNNDGRSGQNYLISGSNNKVTKFSHDSAMIGEELECGYDNKIVLGKRNLDKEYNVFEIGGGVYRGNRKNIFEVNKTGKVSTDGAYLPGYTLIKESVNFKTSTDLIKGTNALNFGDPRGVTSTTSGFCGQTRINISTAKLSTSKKYCIVTDINIISGSVTDLKMYEMYRTSGSGDIVGNTEVCGVTDIGRYLIALPISISSDYTYCGMCLYNSSNFKYKINDIRLYELKSASNSYATENFDGILYSDSAIAFGDNYGRKRYNSFTKFDDEKETFIFIDKTTSNSVYVAPLFDNVAVEYVSIYSSSEGIENQINGQIKSQIKEEAQKIIPVEKGGTGATNIIEARASLGLSCSAILIDGNYTGSGTYGENNLNTINFATLGTAAVQMIIVFGEYGHAILLRNASTCGGTAVLGVFNWDLTWTNNSVSWYCSKHKEGTSTGLGSAKYQFNEDGKTYPYLIVYKEL